MKEQGCKNYRKLYDYNVPGGTEDAHSSQYVSEGAGFQQWGTITKVLVNQALIFRVTWQPWLQNEVSV